MKIFNWVHRRFHNKDDGFGRGVKKAEFVRNESDTLALLEHVDVLNGWREGILTIGTFGIEPLKDFNQRKEYLPFVVLKEHEEEEFYDGEYSIDDVCNEIDEVEERETDPLVVKALSNDFKKDTGDSQCDQIARDNVMVTIDFVPVSRRPHEIGLEDEKRRRNRGERITLADLFSADSEVQTKPDHVKMQMESIKKRDPHAKNGISFAKKLIPRVGEDSRPIHKLQRMMTRMMKRKIHPDLEARIQKKESQIKSGELGFLQDEYGANEPSVSLLQTQDPTVGA
ncbi:hypothetical protein RJ640_008886 [Escallonia rubra]|uniref:Protein TILLER ANGLE CONTROL 1 n=1 Tax=Escallonia rubra TaxID=112253 RepID=A0AA88RQ16_9ASTE|nr:hypothetical protein RJ640_008886 [Escallonia rubra]